MDCKKTSISRSSESQPKKRNAVVKDSLDLWLENHGANIPPEKLKSMQEQVKSNPRLAYYLQFLKAHSRSRPEAKQMKKLYLYKAVKEGELRNDLPENVTVSDSRDVELLRRYTTSVHKTEALKLVKIPEAVKELDKCNELSMKKNHQVFQSTDSFIKNTGHLQLLNSVLNNVNKINSDLRNVINCFLAFTKPKKGSEKLKAKLKFDEEHIQTVERILKVSCAHTDRGNRKEIHRLIIECYKRILSSQMFDNIDKCNPERYLGSIMSNLAPPGSENGQTTPLNLVEIMSNIEKFKDLLSTMKSVRKRIPQYFEAYENFSSGNSQLLLKVNSIVESLNVMNEIRNNFNKKTEANATFLTPCQFAAIKQIFKKWGEDVESADDVLSECIIRKQREHENYRLLIQYMSVISSRQLSIDFKYDDLDAFMSDSLVKFAEHSDKIPDLIHTNKEIGNKILKLTSSMSFFKINNIPITEIIKDIKQTIVDDRFVRNMPIE